MGEGHAKLNPAQQRLSGATIWLFNDRSEGSSAQPAPIAIKAKEDKINSG